MKFINKTTGEIVEARRSFIKGKVYVTTLNTGGRNIKISDFNIQYKPLPEEQPTNESLDEIAEQIHDKTIELARLYYGGGEW